MKYRVLGRTGLKISELGLGGHEYSRFLNPNHFPTERKKEEEVSPEELLKSQDQRNKLIEKAIDAGVNYFDTTLTEECQSLGLALRTLGQRENVHIATETLWPIRRMKESPKSKWHELVLQDVEGRLRLLQTDYVEVFNIHLPEDNYSREVFEALIEILREICDEGKIGAIGAASHNPRFLAELMRKYDCFDSVMVRYNYHLQEARDVLFPLCEALEVGVVVMKPFSWPYYGLSSTHFYPRSLKAGGYTPSQISLKWILGSTEVTTVVPGTNTMPELEENLATFDREYNVDEEVLRQCLKVAHSLDGRQRLIELGEDEEIAQTRPDIQGYAKKTLAN